MKEVLPACLLHTRVAVSILKYPCQTATSTDRVFSPELDRFPVLLQTKKRFECVPIQKRLRAVA